MKVLLDECAPRALKRHLASSGHACSTVQEQGWSGIQWSTIKLGGRPVRCIYHRGRKPPLPTKSIRSQHRRRRNPLILKSPGAFASALPGVPFRVTGYSSRSSDPDWECRLTLRNRGHALERLRRGNRLRRFRLPILRRRPAGPPPAPLAYRADEVSQRLGVLRYRFLCVPKSKVRIRDQPTDRISVHLIRKRRTHLSS
jgi:hypothetical protein